MGTETKPKSKSPTGLKKWLKKKRSTTRAEDEQKLVGIEERSIEVREGDRWDDIDLISSGEHLAGPSRTCRATSSLEEARPGVTGWGHENNAKKNKKKKKFSKKKIRKSTWRAMKGGWKYFKAGLIMFTSPIPVIGVPSTAATSQFHRSAFPNR